MKTYDKYVKKDKNLDYLTDTEVDDLPDYLKYERRLWAACLQRTILDLQLHFCEPPGTNSEWNLIKKELAEEAIDWVEDRSHLPGGFYWVCDVVEIDGDTMYRHIRAVYKTKSRIL